MKNIWQAVSLASLLVILMLLAVACGGSTSAASGQNTVHLTDTTFAQSSITIKKGQTITLVNDTATVHIITNGTWDSNDNPIPRVETGAPKVNDTVGSFGSQTIGPFNTAGTFHLYCTVHPGMNLTIIVK